MNWVIHLVAGIIFAIISLFFLKQNYLVLLLIPFYSLISDIDHKNSKITWVGLSISLCLCLIGLLLTQQILLYFGVGLLSVVLVSVFLFKHRGFTHSIVFGLLVCLPVLYFFSVSEFVVMFLVFYSHLVMDGLCLKFI